MIFWIGILVGIAFVALAVKIGFYETWAMLFNIVMSIYLAVFITPLIASIQGTERIGYSSFIGVAVTAIVTFLILHGISFLFFTSQFNVKVPKIFDILGAGFLGFLAGFAVWSFASLLVLITPVSQQSFIKEIGLTRQKCQANIAYVSWWCDKVNGLVGSGDRKFSSAKVIEKMLNTAEEKRKAKPSADPNILVDPNQTDES
ncbi:hypothetical protein ACFL3G_10910 [Planctomycetota bacterium]